MQLIDHRLTVIDLNVRQLAEGSLAAMSWQLATQAAADKSGDFQLYLRLAGMYENLEFVDEALESNETRAGLYPEDLTKRAKVIKFSRLQTDRRARGG